jgi:hypothetical protein
MRHVAAPTNPEAFTMRTFTPPAGTRFYDGIDLHARALFVIVLDRDGKTDFARNLPANPDAFLRAVAPFRDGLLVACECMHCWYWLADTCRDHHIAFVLGHAWAMQAVRGQKTKCDRKDAEAIAQSYDTLKLADVYAVLSRYLANPAPFEDYLRLCDEAAAQTRRKIEEFQGPQGDLRAILLARAKAKEAAGAEAGQR